MVPQPASTFPRCYPREGHLKEGRSYILTFISYGTNIVVPPGALRYAPGGTSRTGYQHPHCVKNTRNYQQLTEKMPHI